MSLLILIFLFSCGQGNGKPAAAKDTTVAVTAFDRSIVVGRVIDSVNYPSQSYAVYLPANYTPDKQYPCIYFFDAHARGALPLRMYKDIAEQYGFILIGSDVSKNSTPWQVTQGWVEALFKDSRARVNIDAKRVYTAGFSGGSRVASSVAIFIGGVAGVVGCAAGFPQLEQPLQTKFDYFGIVGDHDFNLIEMERLDEGLQQNGFNHQLLISGGMHGWPSAADFGIAVLWLQVNAMKQNLQSKDDKIIEALQIDYLQRRAAAALPPQNKFTRERSLLEGQVETMRGLKSVEAEQRTLAELLKDKKYIEAEGLQQHVYEQEAKQQQELMQAITTQDEVWWEKKIAELKHDELKASTHEASLMYTRLINYLGLVGYLATNHALKTNDLVHAASYLKVFKLADPENADCSYLAAIYYAEKGDSMHTLSALNEAVALGYSEVATLLAEPSFTVLKEDPSFKRVVEKVRQNCAGAVKD